MRVSHVITRLIVGGAQENTVSTAVGLSKIPGVQVDLVSGPSGGSEGTLEDFVKAAGVPLHIIPHLVRPVRPWSDFAALGELTSHYKRIRPDVVHTHSGKAGILGRLAAKQAGVPIIIHTIHGPSFGPFQGPAANFVFRAAEKYAAQFTTHFSVVAEAMAEQYMAAGIGEPSDYTLIFSGFNLDPFLCAGNDPALRARYGIAPEDIVIGKIARLFELKGHEDLFAAAAELVRAVPNAKFLLVGDGPLRARFERLVSELGLKDRVVFTGLVSPAEIPALVGIMDMLVHLSLREGLPRALPQALAAGKPVVAYDCDGAREVCVTGKTGFLIAPRDLNGLKAAVQQLCGDPQVRDTLGAAGREFVRARFSVEKMVADTHALYERLGAR
ncbi:MAG TPA: glycosyltransferase family 4 protein [Methylomirabilota bacterium]|nr:glycosyltransferase family 4 protein [Methylomirabilota bacterium]